MATLREQFEGELGRSLGRIREAIAPYTRFVRAERDKALRLHEELTETAGQLRQLRVAIERSAPVGEGPAAEVPAPGTGAAGAGLPAEGDGG